MSIIFFTIAVSISICYWSEFIPGFYRDNQQQPSYNNLPTTTGKFCETEKFANQKIAYMHNNPCTGKWKLVADPIRYKHSSAKFYINGKHSGYEVMNIEEYFRETINVRPESAVHIALLGDSGE